MPPQANALYKRVIQAAGDVDGGADLGRLVSGTRLEDLVTRYVSVYRGRNLVQGRAVSVVGARIVEVLAVYQLLVEVIEELQLPSWIGDVVWLDLGRRAAIGRVLAERARLDEDAGGIAAICTGIGSILELARTGHYVTWFRRVRPLVGRRRRDAEADLFESDPDEVFEEFAASWALPEWMRKAVRERRDPDRGGPVELPRVVRYAEELADWMSAQNPAVGLRAWMDETAQVFDWSSRGVLLAAERADNDVAKVAELLGVRAAKSKGLAELMAKGGPDVVSLEVDDPAVTRYLEELEEHGYQLEERVRSLRRQLERSGLADPVTGLGTLSTLRDALEGEAVRATASGGSLWLLLIDLDGFTSINASQGFSVGDRVLSQCGRIIARMAPEGSVVARTDGDTFAISTTTSEQGVRILAERIRAGIEGCRFDDIAAGRIRLTATIYGGGLHKIGSPEPSGDALLVAVGALAQSRRGRDQNNVQWLL